MGTPSSNQYFEAAWSTTGPQNDPNLFTAAEIVAGSFDSAAVSAATSKAVSTINAAAPDSTSISQARSQAVSAASVGSVADSKAVSESTNISVVDSRTSSVSLNVSVADSKAVSVQNSVPILSVVANSQNVSTADSKAVSVATSIPAALPANGRGVSTLTSYLSNNAVANVLDFFQAGDANDAPMFQRASDYLQSIGKGGTIRVPTRALNYNIGTTTVTIAGSGIWLVFDSTQTVVTYSGSTWAFNFELADGLSTINNAGAIMAAVQCTNVGANAFRMSRGMYCEFDRCYAENTNSNATGSGYILDGDSQIFAGTGTVSCVAGFATFSQSQAGVIANDYMVIVAGVYYRVGNFNGSTTWTVAGGGTPTFGASAFTFITSGHFCTNVIFRHCRSNNFFVGYDLVGGRVGAGYDVHTDCAVVDCFGNAGAVTAGLGSIGVRCSSGGSENYVVRGNYEALDYGTRFITSPGGTVPINNSLDHVRFEAIATKYWTFEAGAAPTNSVLSPRYVPTQSKIDLTGVATFISAETPSVLPALRHAVKVVTLANGINRSVAIGNASYIEIIGPTADYSIAGFARPSGSTIADSDGRVLYVWSRVSSFICSFINGDATDGAINNSIRTQSSNNETSGTFNGAMAEFRYSAAQGQWILHNYARRQSAAITAPTAPSAGYVQAEAQSMKTAVDAIRTALIVAGITV